MTDHTTDSFVHTPMPALLEEDGNHRHEVDALDESATAETIRAVLARVCGELDDCAAYGRTLWKQLEATADYLRVDLVRGPAGAGLHGDDQWDRWEQAYGSALTVLAGPRGDSGYGFDQARLERRTRAQDHPGNPMQ